MFLLGVPLLIFSFAIYNIIEFVLPGFAWSMEVLRFQLPSGADCAITAGDAMVAGSFGFFERLHTLAQVIERSQDSFDVQAPAHRDLSFQSMTGDEARRHPLGGR